MSCLGLILGSMFWIGVVDGFFVLLWVWLCCLDVGVGARSFPNCGYMSLDFMGVFFFWIGVFGVVGGV